MTFLSTVQGLAATAVWMLDEASGSTAADQGGSAHDGAYISSPALGQTSILHDGTGATSMRTTEGGAGCMSVTSGAWMDATHASAVIRTTVTSGVDGSNGDAIFSRYNAGVYPWLLWRNTTGHWACQINATTNCADAASVTGGQEYTVGFTYDGSNIRLYVDGVKVTTTAYSSSLATGTAPIEVGRYSSSASNTPAGSFSAAAFWAGTVLSDADMAAIHTAATTSPTTGTFAATLDATTLAASGYTDITGTLAATLADTTLAASGTSFAPITGTLAATLDDTTLAAAGTVTPVYDTDTSNALDGLDFGFTATVTAPTPVVAPPATVVLAEKVDKAIAFPTPTMVDGRPT